MPAITQRHVPCMKLAGLNFISLYLSDWKPIHRSQMTYDQLAPLTYTPLRCEFRHQLYHHAPFLLRAHEPRERSRSKVLNGWLSWYDRASPGQRCITTYDTVKPANTPVYFKHPHTSSGVCCFNTDEPQRRPVLHKSLSDRFVQKRKTLRAICVKTDGCRRKRTCVFAALIPPQFDSFASIISNSFCEKSKPI